MTFASRPTGGLAATILFIFLNLNPHQKRPIRDQLAELDFIGLICFLGGVVALLIGFDFSQTSCEYEIWSRRQLFVEVNDLISRVERKDDCSACYWSRFAHRWRYQ